MKPYCAIMLLLFLSLAAKSQVLINDANAVLRNINGPFHGVRVSGAIDLIMAQSDAVAMAVSAASDEQRDAIVTEVKNGILEIHLEGQHLYAKHSSGKMRVYLSFARLDLIDVSGACDVMMQETMKAEQLKLVLSGACNFSGRLEVAHLKLTGSGASTINLKQSVLGDLEVSLSGASSIKGYEAMATLAQVNCSGASDVRLTISSELRVMASGASTIRYKGAPRILQQRLSGMSQLKKVE